MQKIVYVVGIGPGDSRMMTREAWDILTPVSYTHLTLPTTERV